MTTKDAILKALTSGAMSDAEISTRGGISVNTVRKVRNELVKAGLVQSAENDASPAEWALSTKKTPHKATREKSAPPTVRPDNFYVF